MAFVAPCAVPLRRLSLRSSSSPRVRGGVGPAAARRPGGARLAAAAGAGAAQMTSGEGSSSGAMTLDDFLAEAATHALSTVRFISVTPAAVLETVGRLDYGVTAFAHPTKGRYLTLASIDKTFELHVRVEAVRTVTLTTEKAKMGGHDLHVIRFRDERDDLVLSMLLQYDPSRGPGNYLAGAVDAFNALRDKLGASVTLTAPAAPAA